MKTKNLYESVIKYYDQCKNFSETSRVFGISDNTVRNWVKGKIDQTGKKLKNCGRKKKLSKTQQTRVKRKVRTLNSEKKRVTAALIKEEYDLENVSVRTVRRTISSLEFRYCKPTSKIVLTAKHKKARLEFAKNCIKDNHDWNITIFTDEKRFCLDGPDSWSSWMDPNDKIIKNNRQNKGGGIMVWGALFPNGYLHIVSLEGRINSQVYQNFINDDFKPFIDMIYPDGNYYLQQDNCSVHVSKSTLKFFEENNIRTFKWPSKSPDLNIIENIWKTMSSIVYDEKCQYNTLDELWKAIDRATSEINVNRLEYVQSLFRSIPSRLVDVISRKGDIIDY